MLSQKLYCLILHFRKKTKVTYTVISSPYIVPHIFWQSVFVSERHSFWNNDRVPFFIYLCLVDLQWKSIFANSISVDTRRRTTSYDIVSTLKQRRVSIVDFFFKKDSAVLCEKDCRKEWTWIAESKYTIKPRMSESYRAFRKNIY